MATVLLALLLIIEARPAIGADFADAIAAIAQTDGSPTSDQEASAAAQKLQAMPSNQVTIVLAGFPNATKRGRNWLRSLAADVCDNGAFPKQTLLDFFNDRDFDADARHVAYQLLTLNEPDLNSQLLTTAETDPSLPVRYLKIQSMIDQAAQSTESQPDQAIALLRAVVQNGRSPKQLEKATKLLAELDVKIDLADELGMMRRWWLIGPFDNTDSKHFDTAYVPENRYLESGSPIATDVSGNKKPDAGKDRPAEWQQIESDDRLGMVDLNEPLAGEKDAAAYAFIKFKVESDPSNLAAQIRIGCVTANKVWVNGRLVSSNEVYHSGTRIDQYVDDCELVAGENTILVKVMQNAQTQPWAQDWQFQFRLTRPDGNAIKTSPVE